MFDVHIHGMNIYFLACKIFFLIILNEQFDITQCMNSKNVIKCSMLKVKLHFEE